MKKYLFLIVSLVIVSCTDQLVMEDAADERVELTSASEVASLMEKARWGDGDAYVKLADCYRDGKGVKADFIGMLGMVSFADEYGGIERVEDYLSTLPEGSEYKRVFDAMEKFTSNKQDEALAMADQLIAEDCVEGLTVKGIILNEQGNTEEGKSLLELAAEKGSGFAEIYLCIPDLKHSKEPDVTKLTAMTDRLPIANTCLGKIYTGSRNENLKDEKLAAYYYLRADEQACLGKDGAKWLLGYYHSGGDLKLSETDIKRLEILAGLAATEPEIVCHKDENLEAGITELLNEDMDEWKMWTMTVVYVVETKTGRIKADVSYQRKGNKLVPYTDTYNQEQSVMECGSTYLALLSSGGVTPESVFDTGCGIYGEVRDHNWRRGGYQEISLERALEVRSQVAFTMAKERVWGSNTAEFDSKVASYLADNPNSPMGMLTFYNAVANGGKMVELVSEGDGMVLQEQIAEPQYVKQLQTGLEHCVSQGLMRKAGRDYVKVSACGRTFITKGSHRRMELCGYFPSDNPLYTIMVITEKDNLPASAGGICGPIFAKTIDLLVDKYKLEPMLVREYEDVDEVIEIVDTVAVAN